MGTKKGVMNIHATIHVERDSQRGILLGKGGENLKPVEHINGIVEYPYFGAIPLLPEMIEKYGNYDNNFSPNEINIYNDFSEFKIKKTLL